MKLFVRLCGYTQTQRTAAAREEQRIVLERRLEQEVQALCDRIVEEYPVFLEHAVVWAAEHADGFHFAYKPSKTPAENYRDSIAVQAMLNPHLERQHPKGFAEIRARHKAEMDAL